MTGLPMKQVLMFCDCGNHMTATVFRDIPFDLTCSKCKRHYLGCSCDMMVYHDGVFKKWQGGIKEKKV